MSGLDEVRGLLGQGREADAAARLKALADGGDAEAAFLFANWRLYGLYGSRDAAGADRYLRKAGEKGHVEAIRVRAFLLANGGAGEGNQTKAPPLLPQSAPGDR